MQKESEILSLWVGPSSQKAAHHFYCLQAEQIFDEAEDPTNHNALWNFKDKYMQQKYPRMIIFDTESEHLTKIRKISHENILKKMSEPSKNDVYFPFQYMPQPQQQEQEQQDPTQWLYEHWNANEDNYALIDVEFNEQRVSYDLWETFFNYQNDQYEDKIRRHLEKTDFLRLFTICTDAEKIGFTNRIVEYLRDQCPKRSIVMTSLSNQKGENYFNQCFLPLVGHIAPQVNLLVDVNIQPSAHAYFQGDDFYHSISPVLNSLYTPFMLKNVNCDQFLLKMQHDNRTIFNVASTLPVIDQQMSLHPLTNILQYLPKIDPKSGKKQEDHPETRNKLNYSNNSFLNIVEPNKQSPKVKAQLENIRPLPSQVIAESFVMKGNFKEVTEFFQQKTNNFEIKYLKGILASNHKANLRYSQFYRQHYGQVVQNFPFHTVLFQHAGFGPSIRNFMKFNYSKKVGSEMISEWRESALAQADSYCQCVHDESD